MLERAYKAKAGARIAEAKSLKLLRERKFYAPERELTVEKARGDEMKRELRG